MGILLVACIAARTAGAVVVTGALGLAISYLRWRDLGYAIGALSAGIIADVLGLSWAIATIAALTFLSGVVVTLVMREPSTVRR
jgi:hypothetical protein